MNHHPLCRQLSGILGLLLLTLSAGFASAQATYPERQVRIVIPFPPGGPSDVLGRSLAQKLTASLGRPVIAENKPGAGTNLAADMVA
ncbi:MAG: hypothetical protein RIT26_2361, partial [Pseudomonadota bacterium]